MLRHDRRRTLRFAALQGEFGTLIRGRHPELEGVDSIVWVDPPLPEKESRVLVRSDAALRVARYLGGRWALALPLGLIPRALRDAAYDLIARHRHRLAGSAPNCLVPAPEVRERFLDERTERTERFN